MRKADSGAGPSLSDRTQRFGEKAKGSSSVGSYWKKKLHGVAAHGLKEGVESSRYLQKEDVPEEQNVAEEVLESSKRTGEKVTGSAGKVIQKRQIKKKMITSAHQKRVKGFGTMGRFLNGVENAVGKAGEDLAKAVAEHPIPVVGALVLGILILVVVVSLSSCSLLIGSFHGSADGCPHCGELKFVAFRCHAQFCPTCGNDTANRLEETVKEGTVIEEKRSEIFIDSENQMSVVAPDKFGGHFRGTVKAIFINGTTIGGIPAINHLRNIFHDNRTRMESIFNFLIMIFKNIL